MWHDGKAIIPLSKQYTQDRIDKCFAPLAYVAKRRFYLKLIYQSKKTVSIGASKFIFHAVEGIAQKFDSSIILILQETQPH